jgi:hypothetical protein
VVVLFHSIVRVRHLVALQIRGRPRECGPLGDCGHWGLSWCCHLSKHPRRKEEVMDVEGRIAKTHGDQHPEATGKNGTWEKWDRIIFHRLKAKSIGKTRRTRHWSGRREAGGGATRQGFWPPPLSLVVSRRQKTVHLIWIQPAK